MLVISALSILLLAAVYDMWRRSEEQPSLRGSHGEMLRLGVQIICGDCCGDSDRPVKTYLDRLGRCGQCGGRAYVLASVCARHPINGARYDNTMMERPAGLGEARPGVRRQASGSQVSLHAVRINKVSA